MHKNQGIKSEKSSAINLVYVGTTIIILYFNPNLQDPFNAPKFWLLIILAASLLGYLAFPKAKYNNKINSKLKLTLIIFCVSGLISAVFSKNQLISLLGENQRKNGFATYLGSVIIFYLVAKTINLASLNKFSTYLRVTSIILVIYGFMQTTGNDFVTWSNPYNSVIGTAGNPNFSSAIFAILGTYFLTSAILSIRERSLPLTIFDLILSLLLIVSILNTNSLQGVLALIIGVISFVLAILVKYRKKMSYVAGFLVAVVMTFGILGMLQTGPLQSYLYKDSVSVRGYYWRAGVEMLKNHPLLGVGIDNYAAYFNIYRTFDYPIRYGFEVTSSNAHNTFIQHFATGGIFFGLAYLLIQIYVLVNGIKLINRSEAKQLKLVLPVFCSWLTFQAQSLVSIDNIAISIMGWLFGGIIIGISAKSNSEVPGKLAVKKNSNEIKQVMLSYAMVLVAFIFCTYLYRVESSMIYLRGIYNPANVENSKLVLNNGVKFFELPFNNINYQNQVGVYIAASGYPNEAVNLLEKSLNNTPNSIDTLNVLANIYESGNKPNLAIPYRIRLIELNPWNAKNYLQLGKNYRDLGEYSKMDSMLLRIKSFASSTEVYKIATTELVKP